MLKKNILIIISSLLLFISLNTITYANSDKKTEQIDVQKEFTALHAKAPDLNPNVLKLGLKAYAHAAAVGEVKNPYLTVIDFSKPSTQKRFWVFNLKRDRNPYETLVAHGKNSGKLRTTHFSNQPGSKASSFGVYLTKGTYYGGKGLSLRLQGLENGINNNAYRRDIVIHGAWYATSTFVKNHGYLGRSWGCPALPKNLAKPIINTIKNGSVLFAYYPNQSWLRHSKFLA